MSPRPARTRPGPPPPRPPRPAGRAAHRPPAGRAAANRTASGRAPRSAVQRAAVVVLGRTASPRPARWQPPAAALITLVAWWTALVALEPLFSPGPWRGRTLALVAVIMLTPALVRAVRPSRDLIAMVAAFLAGGAGLALLLNDLGALGGWLKDPSAQLRAIGEVLVSSAPPVDVGAVLGGGVLVAAALLSLACVLMSDGGADAVGATALVPGIALLAPTLILGRAPRAHLVLTVGLCALLLVVVSAPRGARCAGSRLRAAGTALGGGASRLVTAALALILAVGVLGRALPVPILPWSQPGGAAAPEVRLTLNQDLVRGSSAPVLQYSGLESGTSVRLTLAVIADLGGDTWTPLDDARRDAAVDKPQPGSGAGALTPGGALRAADGGAADTEKSLPAVEVRVTGMRSHWLPVLQSTLTIDDGQGVDLDDWSWVSGTSTALSGSSEVVSGARYRVRGWSAVADAQGHPQTPVGIPAPTPDPGTLDPYLELPASMPGVISDTAQAVVDAAGAGSDPAARAAALAAWFHGNGFVYNEQVPGSFDGAAGSASPVQVVVSFLNERTGYCVHYSAAFTLMARSLGLPTRIAVGYASTSTAASAGDWVTVGGSQLHAWPEVWIDGVGWLAFEPTPGGIGGQVGAVRAPTTPAAPPTATPSAQAEPTAPAGEQETGAQTSAPTAQPNAPAPAPPAERTGGGGASLDARIPALILLVLLLAALPGLIRALQRSRRRAAVRRGPRPGEAAWRELVATAVDLDLLHRGTRLRARTPEALAEHLADELGGAAAGGAGGGPGAGTTGAGGPGDGGPPGTGAGGPEPGAGAGGPPVPGPDALAALTRLAGDVVAERYGTAPADSGRRRRIEDDLGLVTAVMSQTAPPGRRLLARIVPRSMVGGRFAEA